MYCRVHLPAPRTTRRGSHRPATSTRRRLARRSASAAAPRLGAGSFSPPARCTCAVSIGVSAREPRAKTRSQNDAALWDCNALKSVTASSALETVHSHVTYESTSYASSPSISVMSPCFTTSLRPRETVADTCALLLSSPGGDDEARLTVTVYASCAHRKASLSPPCASFGCCGVSTSAVETRHGPESSPPGLVARARRVNVDLAGKFDRSTPHRDPSPRLG